MQKWLDAGRWLSILGVQDGGGKATEDSCRTGMGKRKGIHPSKSSSTFHKLKMPLDPCGIVRYFPSAFVMNHHNRLKSEVSRLNKPHLGSAHLAPKAQGGGRVSLGWGGGAGE